MYQSQISTASKSSTKAFFPLRLRVAITKKAKRNNDIQMLNCVVSTDSGGVIGGVNMSNMAPYALS